MTTTPHANANEAYEDRLTRVEAIVEANARSIGNLREVEAIVEANARSIGQLRDEAADFRAGFSDLRAGFNELREGQALLTQVLVEQRDLNAEFRRNTNAALDRIDRTMLRFDQNLAEFRRTLDYLLRREGENRG